ncbi:PEP-utilizing enzyme [Photorhabdus thracensis]|uniref:PEP-utilizing enzyme n=1 Tax=Photorhabdus thracensis TaxID=230089 RepID=UPI0009E56E31|nr:hypothetical protein [Photorhabdus thracensis]
MLAHELIAPTVISLNKRVIKAIVLGEGSALSHSAMLANAMVIPMIVGVGEALAEVGEGQIVYVNAARGEVKIN